MNTLNIQPPNSVQQTRLKSKSTSYIVQGFVGKGAFGRVVRCTRMSDNKMVAIKMIRSDLYKHRETEVLQKLQTLDLDRCNIVRWHGSFFDKGHYCLEFEELQVNLRQFIRERQERVMHVKEIRPIVKQISNALCHLNSLGIIHADLKSENVMLVNHRREPYKVKIIDFGLAYDVSADIRHKNIQTLYYRAPEVMLGANFTEAIDMWSLGCIAAELYLGRFLYRGDTENDVINGIVTTQGQLPVHLLDSGSKTKIFFKKDSRTRAWKLKKSRKDNNQIIGTLRSLDELLWIHPTAHPNSYATTVGQMTDVLFFVELIKEMLELNPAERITACRLLNHPFISMNHITLLYHLSSQVKSSVDLMDAHRETRNFQGPESVSPLPTRLTCGTAQTRPRHIPTGMKCEVIEQDSRRSRRLIEIHESRLTRSGKKRKRNKESEIPSKSFKPTTHQQEPNQGCKISELKGKSSSHSQIYIEIQDSSPTSSGKKRKKDAESETPSRIFKPTTHQQDPDQSCTMSGLKRQISSDSPICVEIQDSCPTSSGTKRRRDEESGISCRNFNPTIHQQESDQSCTMSGLKRKISSDLPICIEIQDSSPTSSGTEGKTRVGISSQNG